eukprot:TRINITY_DN15052_c0_g1_i1.p1 TRINITY_DN15052_c0_g1~~TRINITY_DN15052_c0_g1_i1.p1  ORF type:complete len:152 (+),score=2.00 TRINITY_DN15052_c0_g1_i1:315-770(+)
MGKSRRNSKGHSNHTKYSQQHQRIGTHCLKVWECVLFYQSNFLMKYLHKNHQLYEKLRLIDQDRNAFLKWLQREGLNFTQQTFERSYQKPWDDCWQTEKALLRQRWEEDLKKTRNQIKELSNTQKHYRLHLSNTQHLMPPYWSLNRLKMLE